MQKVIRAYLFLLLGLAPASLQSQSVAPWRDQLIAGYKGKQLMLQGCYCGKELKYDPQGNLIEGGEPGSWTICRDVRINELQIVGQKLQIAGQRVYLAYDAATKTFRSIDEILDHKSKRYQDLIETQVVKIEVALPQLDQSNPGAVLNEIFWPGGFNFSHAAPDLWKSFFPGETTSSSAKKCVGPPQLALSANKTPQVTPRDERPSFRGNGPTPPKLIYSPDPEFSDAARKAIYEGVSVLKVQIGVDGSVHSIEIVRPIGMGLDEKAVDSARQWKFEPAIDRNGQPVATWAMIEVNFRKY